MKKRNAGFTLAELLVTITIITIISSLVFVNFRSGEKSLALDRSAHKVAQDIRRTMEIAMRSQIYQEGTGQENKCANNDPISPGYGIHFTTVSPPSYFSYVDCIANKKYQSGQDEKLEIFSLEKGVNIDRLDPVTNMSIFFESPDLKVYVNGFLGNEASIVLESGGRERTITVTDKGVIDID